MKKQIILTITIIILNICLTSHKLTLKTKEYRDKVNGFSIKYPSLWQASGNPQSKGLIKADIVSPDQKTGMQIRIYKNTYQKFSDFVAWYTDQFEKEMKPIIRLETKYQDFGDLSGCVICFDGRQRNGYFLKSYLILSDNKVFVFQSGILFEKRSDYEYLLDSIVKSFTIDRHYDKRDEG